MAVKKIAILADVPLGRIKGLESYGPPTGHYATWLEALIPEFEAFPEFEFHWIIVSKLASQLTTHQALGQTFHVLPRNRKLVSMLSGYLLETRKIRTLLQTIQPDLLHAWGSEDVYGLAGARSGFKPRVFTLQGCLNECVARDRSAHWLLRFQAAFEAPTVRAYDTATGESPIAVSHLQRLNPQISAQLIDYGVATTFFDAKWNPASAPNVLFAGSLNASKGLLDLLDVFESPHLRNVTLNIAGDGELFDEIKNLRIPNIRLLGRLSRNDLIPVMEATWGLAIPTHADTGPSILKEARVVGLPVVTTKAAGASHYIQSAGCGFVTDPGDRDALSLAISNMVATREASIELGQKGWQHHRELLHPSITAFKLIQLYRSLVA